MIISIVAVECSMIIIKTSYTRLLTCKEPWCDANAYSYGCEQLKTKLKLSTN